jgi:phosphatidylglycerophosphate synthase
LQQAPDSVRGALGTQIGGLIAVIGAAIAARMTLPLSASYPAKAAIVFGIVMAVVLTHVRGDHPFVRFGPANQLTTLRAVLVALITALIGERATPAALSAAAAIAACALAVDGLDGWAARRTHLGSAFGARFDVEVDALLIQVLAILAWQYGKAGWWVLLSGLIRYVFVAAGWLWPWMNGPLPPTRRARFICVIQVAALIVVIAPAVMPPASAIVAALALIALAYSFFVDTVRLWRTVQTSESL